MNRILKNIKSAFLVIKTKDPKSQKLQLFKLKFLLPYLKKHWKKMAFASILTIIVSLIALPIPLLMKYIIDTLIPDKNFRLLNHVILLLASIQLVKLLISFLTNYYFNILNQEVLLTLKNDLFKKILSLPLSFFDSSQTGYIMSRIGEVNSLGIFFSSSAVRILIAIFEFVFCLFILLYMHWKLTLVSLLILPFFYFITKHYSHGIRKASRDVFEKGALLSRQFQESIAGIEVIKTFASEERESQKVRRNLADYMRSSIITNIIQSISGEGLALLGAMGSFIVLWYGGSEIMRENFTIGGYVAFAAYLGKLYGPTQIMASLGLTIQPAASALNRVKELFDIASDEEDENRIIRLAKVNGAIEFKNVSFSYDHKKNVLRNISFKINPGEKVAFVGPNGSGKSTIIKLILGLYKTGRGKITIDGHNINLIVLSTLRAKISTVSQNIFLFNDSIKNNIRYSNPNAREEEIIGAAKKAGAYEFIMNLENKFDTIIGETGKKISGGEKQKISISRAFIKNSEIIIFDEATSHLDNESMKKIQTIINEEFENKTCIIVTHQLSESINIDRIYKLKKGEININYSELENESA